MLTDGWSSFIGDAPIERVSKPDEGTSNRGLGEVTLSQRGGNSYKLKVEVVGAPGPVRVEALVDGKARAATRVTLPASGRAVAQLTLGLEPGRYRLELRLPEDPRSADNRRQSLLVASGPTRLLAVNGDARDSAYADELYYVGQAARALIITTRLRSSRSRRVRSTARRSKRRTSCCSRTSPGLTRVLRKR